MQLERNFFTLLNLPCEFSIDAVQLKRSARELLRQYHPDRYASATPQEQRLAVQFTAHINHAVATLDDPVSRAFHLLELRGVDIDPQQLTIKDRQFLMEQMDIREAVSAADGNAEKVAAVVADIEQRFAAEQSQFATQLSKSPGEAVTEDDAGQLVEQVLRMQFYSKLLAELRDSAAVVKAR